jgi:hypothetical protein
MHARYLSDDAKIDALAWLTAAASGLLLATLHQIRAEAVLIGLSLPLVYLTIRRARWIRRIGLVAVLLASYFLTSQAWQSYWDRKFTAAQAFVAAHGGAPYAGPHASSHVLWHSVYIGLGDFGKDRGFRWDDRAGFVYATPFLRSQYHLNVTYSGGYYFNESYDPAGVYRLYPPELPQYNRVMRDAVLQTIERDPLWYAGVLVRRLWRIVVQTTPVSIALGPWRVGIPGAGFLILPVVILLFLRKKIFFAKLILFTWPLSLTALLVYSGDGTPYYGISHIVTVGILLYLLISPIQNRA